MTPADGHEYLAHAFGVRYELPIPLLAFVLGGAAVVAVSFLLVLPTGVASAPAPSADRTAVRAVSPTAGIAGSVILGLLIWAGLAGSQEVPENILPTVFWIYVWVVLPLLCGLVGDFTGAINPFGFLAQLGERVAGRRGRLAVWPRWLGWWPAVALAGLGTLAELVFNSATTLPRVLAWILLGYGTLCLLMGAVFGAQAWRERGELFTVLFATWGRLGWHRFGAPGRRGFAGGLEAPFQRTVSRTIFVLLLLASISYDGILSTPQWARFERRVIPPADLPTQRAVRTAGFVILIGVLYLIFATFAFAVTRAGRRRGTGATLCGVLPSMVPIAFGYLLAHYLQYVLINGQLLLPLLGAPGGSGTSLHLPFPFNDSYEVHAHFVPNGFYWYVDVIVIVTVHIAAVVIAHRYLTRTADTVAMARRAEYPWILAMVGYTSLSLWLLAQPLTEPATQ